MYKIPLLAVPVLLAALAGVARAGEPAAPSNEPKPVPLMRPEMKEALDRLKHRVPRLPLPPVEDGERAVNNGRMRSLYLPAELRSGGFSREPDPHMSFDYAFSTMLFWITSRVNNCHYCLGHQENKLLSAGVPEERIAALDGDWREFTAAERAAFDFSRKLTWEPLAVSDADFERLRKHYSDRQILEIVFLTARYNATNRWTDALGIPQEDHRTFTTPTAEDRRKLLSAIAPVESPPTEATVAPAAAPRRPKLESQAEVLARLEAARERRPRLPLVSETEARAALQDDSDEPLPNWVRLLTNFPKHGTNWVRSIRAAEAHGRLSPVHKAQIAWVAARHDRAWYALAHAQRRLRELGASDAAIAALADEDRLSDPAGQRVVAFARKLTVAPQLIADADIAGLREHFSDHEVAEIVYHVTQAAFFNRLTEAAALPIE